MASELLKNRALIQKLKEPDVPRVKFDLASTGFEELFTLPEPKPQELLDIQEENRKGRLLDSLNKIGGGLMDESVDFIKRERFQRGKLVMGPNKGTYPLTLRDRETGEYVTTYHKTIKELKDYKKEYDAQGPGQGAPGVRKGGAKTRIPFTKKQQEIAEAFAKKIGVSVDDLNPLKEKT